MAIVDPSPADMACGTIMASAGGAGASTKLAKRKLNNLGMIRSHSGVQNNPEQIKRMKAQLQLAESMAAIQRQTQTTKAANAANTIKNLQEVAPQALQKLQAKNNDPAKLKKVELCAILRTHFNVRMEEAKTSKPDLVKALQEAMADKPMTIPQALAAVAEPVAPIADTVPHDANDGAEEEQADPQAAVNQQAADALN